VGVGVCVCTYSSQYREEGRVKERKPGAWILRAKEIFPSAILDTRAIGSSALV